MLFRSLGYPRTNILFQTPTRAILAQNGSIALDADISDPASLVEILRLFFEFNEPHIEQWDRAAREFSERIPDIAQGALKLIAEEHRTNKTFRERFTAFANLCRESINPDLKDEAVEEMLVQHLLTERIFRRIFNNSEFTRRNIIAIEIEKVIDSLTAKHFSRDKFLEPLERFYKSIEEAAAATGSCTEKQAFLNKIYERFFQGFSKKQADTHGIVYTPQPIVDFMVKSVEEVLKSEFGRSLSDKGVHILDPFVGTGNFITRIMQEIPNTKIQHKYKEELHCNEVMLLPYYIASMNIEHVYLDKVGEYEPFEGICLVDTFENSGQASLFSTENTNRIRRQMAAPIRVVIANPPYNMGQQNENDQNKNRRYAAKGGVDERVAGTYSKDSQATLRNKLSDPYVKAFRWATDRIKDHGVVCFVSNSSFIDQIAFDGMRKHLMQDFSRIYVIDLGGDVRKNPKLSGTTHNVFGIQIGVAITILIRRIGNDTQRPADVLYARVGETWKRDQKYAQLIIWETIDSVPWKQLAPDAKNRWLTEGQQDDFQSLTPLGIKESKGDQDTDAVFRLFSLGVASNRDEWIYSFHQTSIRRSFKKTQAAFNSEKARYELLREDGRENYAPVVDEKEVKWTDRLIAAVTKNEELKFSEDKIRDSAYRPFTATHMYFDHLLNQRRYQQHHIFPLKDAENLCLCVNSSPGSAGTYCLEPVIKFVHRF